MRKRALILGVPIGLLCDSKSNLGWRILVELFFDEAEKKYVAGSSKKGVGDC
jgi:hypothetical protein